MIDEEIKNNVKNISRSKLRIIYKIQKLIIAYLQNSNQKILGDQANIKDDNNQFYNLAFENEKKLESELEMRYQQIQMLRQNNYAKLSKKQKGKYIGDINKKQTYHYSDKCEHWKALMFDFHFNKKVSNEIILQNNSSYFDRLEMKECQDCRKYKKSERNFFN
ncbi:MAG: hypothetical protein QNJ68_06090 [Microcoleaceae cyanobacterium MO_207.B10]|nr:hypothetical protein [Microcoleaceae cyanobacterium MO_207.B10]